MTAETKGTPSIVRAVTPTRNVVKDTIVTIQANPKNFFPHHHKYIARDLDRDTARFQRG